MKKKMLLIFTLIVSVFLSGCRHIWVGGSGKVGDIRGSGEVDIPLPEKND